MTEKMTYEKLFKALKEGKKIKGVMGRLCYLCAGKYLTNEDGLEYPYLADEILQNGIESFEIIEEPKKYDMTYRKALMYMLEKPGVHCASHDYDETMTSFLYLNKDTLQVIHLNWRTDADVAQQSDAGTTKYKKGDKLLTHADVFQALLNGHKLKPASTDSAHLIWLEHGYIVDIFGEIMIGIHVGEQEIIWEIAE